MSIGSTKSWYHEGDIPFQSHRENPFLPSKGHLNSWAHSSFWSTSTDINIKLKHFHIIALLN